MRPVQRDERIIKFLQHGHRLLVKLLSSLLVRATPAVLSAKVLYLGCHRASDIRDQLCRLCQRRMAVFQLTQMQLYLAETGVSSARHGGSPQRLCQTEGLSHKVLSFSGRASGQVRVGEGELNAEETTRDPPFEAIQSRQSMKLVGWRRNPAMDTAALGL